MRDFGVRASLNYRLEKNNVNIFGKRLDKKFFDPIKMFYFLGRTGCLNLLCSRGRCKLQIMCCMILKKINDFLFIQFN